MTRESRFDSRLQIRGGSLEPRRVTRQLTEACGWQEAPRYIVRDRDGAYGEVFIHRLRVMGIRDRPIAPHSPWQNAYAERLIGSIRRDGLDHVIVFGERFLRHLLKSYQEYYNEALTNAQRWGNRPALLLIAEDLGAALQADSETRSPKIVRELKVVSEPDALLTVLKRPAYHLKRIGLEAGPLSQWLYSALAEAGLPVICVETRHLRAALKAQINKTDRNDARGIAQMMRAGLYRPAHVKTLRSQKLRMLLTHRKLLQSKAIAPLKTTCAPRCATLVSRWRGRDGKVRDADQGTGRGPP